MKVSGATSLMELQQLMGELSIAISVDYTHSAGCWRATVGKKNDAFTMNHVGIGRDVAEAIANALHNYENHIIQEKIR